MNRTALTAGQTLTITGETKGGADAARTFTIRKVYADGAALGKTARGTWVKWVPYTRELCTATTKVVTIIRNGQAA